jgi:hypothetical protein
MPLNKLRKVISVEHMIVILFIGLLSVTSSQAASNVASSPAPASTEANSAVDFARKAVQKAFAYKKGDRDSLLDAKGEFTHTAWREFLKPMQGYLDLKGAPLTNSNFSPMGVPVIKGQDKNTVHVSVPGVLEQETRNAKGVMAITPYSVVAEVDVVGTSSMKINNLKLRPCAPGSSVTPCQ